MSDTRQSRFLDAIEHLNIKFPVAEIAKKTGFQESTVSTYISKREVSENFLRKFCEVYGLDFKNIWNGPAPTTNNQKIKTIVENEEVLNVTNDDGPEAEPTKRDSERSIYKLAESNRVLALAQQDAITTIKNAVAAAQKTADGNLILIEANNRMAGLLVEMQNKSSIERDLRDSLTGANATLEVLRELILQDGVGKRWKSVDEGAVLLNKLTAEALQSNKVKGIHDGAHR